MAQYMSAIIETQEFSSPKVSASPTFAQFFLPPYKFCTDLGLEANYEGL